MAALLALLLNAQAAPMLTVGVPLEYNVLGQNIGLRPELLVGGPQGTHNLRVAAGVLPGPEYLYLPANLGYRLIVGRRAGWPVLPAVGGGVETQVFVLGDAPAVRRVAYTVELGASWQINPHWALGAQAAGELSLYRVPGFGVSVRALLSWTPELGARG